MINNVLVVDDEAGIREAIGTFLEIGGLRAIEAKNGQDALEIIKKNKDIKFVISDFRMPNGNGLFLLEEVRKIDPVLPVIILLCGQAEITREDAIKKGALDMFIKPPNMDDIIDLIKNSIHF